ncbi:hypothetical protein DPMN_075276 [Dreissena polymorpha]|uniref:Uncharacterized protein n=1 Tax=Dreissena polymorpha TaxID=45954 RepID=A0A9D3YKS4_DREPO|nr:hypothetical protein DPMN_075276 [Dreissena polymorpha]
MANINAGEAIQYTKSTGYSKLSTEQLHQLDTECAAVHISEIGTSGMYASRVLTRKNAPPPGGHVFQPTGIIFKFVQDIIRINLLTKVLTSFINDPPVGSHTINVASRVLTRKNAPPPGGHVFQPTGIIL